MTGERVVRMPPVMITEDGIRCTVSTFTSSPMLPVEAMDDGLCGWTHQVWAGGVHLVYRCDAPAHDPDVEHTWTPS